MSKQTERPISEIIQGNESISPANFASIEEACLFASGLAEQARHLIDIGMALSGERDINRLFEMIVDEARRITNADAGTLYIVNSEQTHLDFTILQNDTMNVRMGGTSGIEITLPPVPLFIEDGHANHSNVSAHVAHAGGLVNIDDVYTAEGFDFTGPKKYDEATGYRSRSMVVVALQNHEEDTIGVLQLLNSKDKKTDEVKPFDPTQLSSVAALASQAAVALTNTQLIEDLTNFLYAFIQSIAKAIDEKSPFTAGHINRVVTVTMSIAERINEMNEGVFADVRFSEDELEELKIAAWMHDVGKIVTPEHVMNKSTKLETIFDRVALLETRFHLIYQLKKSEHLEHIIEMRTSGADAQSIQTAKHDFEQWAEQFESDSRFVLSCNSPGEFMTDEALERLHEISAKTYIYNDTELPYVTQDELTNLSVRKGSLTLEERKIMEAHATVTTQMLSELPFIKRLQNVPQYAGRHHEKLDGTGYPEGLTKDDLSLQARILAVADIFEALTARDRPYKKPMGLPQAVKILGFMEKDNHIDSDVLQLFISSGLHEKYMLETFGPESLKD